MTNVITNVISEGKYNDNYLYCKIKINILMNEKEKIKQYLESKGISKNSFYQRTGFSVGFLDSGKSLGADKIKIIIDNYPDLSLAWLVLDQGDMTSNNSITNGSGVVLNGTNSNNSIDNRQYYSDSPDVLKAQIDLLDERIKEKDAQIKEKDAQIRKLLEIMEKVK